MQPSAFLSDLVDLVVAAHERHDELLVGFEDHGLDEVRLLQVQEGGDVGHRAGAGGVHGLGGGRDLAGPGRHLGDAAGGGLLEVGAVAAGAGDDRVLAGVGQHHILMRLAAADVAGVGLDRGVAQPATVEDAAVRVLHGAVRLLEARGRGVERVGVLHQELAPAHEAEAGADLVPELGVDLVEVDRELAIRGDAPAHGVGDDLLGRGSAAELALAVLDAQ